MISCMSRWPSVFTFLQKINWMPSRQVLRWQEKEKELTYKKTNVIVLCYDVALKLLVLKTYLKIKLGWIRLGN